MFSESVSGGVFVGLGDEIAAVEAEREFVEVVGQVLGPNGSLVGAQQPALDRNVQKTP